MNIETENGTPETLELPGQTNFLHLTAGASALPVRTSLLQENEKALTETEVPSFEKYFDSLGKRQKKRDLNGCCMKTLRECLVATKDSIILPFCLKWTGGGYDIEWQLLDSQCHGVPQHRERVYTIGHFRRCGTRKVFPLKGTDGTDCLGIKQIGSYDRPERKNPSAYRVYDPTGISPTLNTGNGGQRTNDFHKGDRSHKTE